MRSDLPAREFSLTRALIRRLGMTLSRARIEQQIYGCKEKLESDAVDVLVPSIRGRFDKDKIHNMRGAGWRATRDMA